MELIRRAVLMGLVVGVVGVVVLFLSNPFDSKPTPSMSGDFTPAAPTLIPADGLATDHGLGAADAPVVHLFCHTQSLPHMIPSINRRPQSP